MMREFVQRKREERGYDEFLRHKVEIARAQKQAGLHYSDEEIETEFAVRRTALLRESDEAGT